MRCVLLLAALLLLLSCNTEKVKGVLRVFSSFTLTDEDGRRISLPVGTHAAEFTYKWHDMDIELEIKDIDAGKDRDFDFKAPAVDENDVSTSKTEERVKMYLPASDTGQGVNAEVQLINIITKREKPDVFWDRCNAYHGSKGGAFSVISS